MKQSGSKGAESQGDGPGFRLPLSRSAPPIVIASASPRRRELIGFLGVPFGMIATDAEERSEQAPVAVLAALPRCPVPLPTHPTLLAWRKANVACAEAPDSVIIGADTIVVLDGHVLGKPRDRDHAHTMLRRLSGRTHTVYTGLAVIRPEKRDSALETSQNNRLSPVSRLLLELVASDVTVAELADAEIDAYIATGEPMDKAGAYGIQGLGGRLVREVVGSYTCVVGLPLVALHHMLTDAGLAGLVDPTEAYLRWLGAQGKEPLSCPPTFP